MNFPYSDPAPNGDVSWRFRCDKENPDPNHIEENGWFVFQGTFPVYSVIPQAAIDDLVAAGWRVQVFKDQNHTAVLDTAAPIA